MPLIFKFTMPLLLGNLLQQTYSLIDAAIVGKFLGISPLAAVGASSSVIFLILGFCNGCCCGFGIPVAQKFGARDYESMRRYVYSSLKLTAWLSVSIAVVTSLLCAAILRWMSTPENIFSDAYWYLLITFIGVPATFYYNLLSSIIRALGDSKTPTILLASGLSLNIIFEPIAILVFDWGIPGAALATLASQVCGNLLCLVFILRKVPALHAHRHDWRPDLKFYWEHLRIALPMGFQSSIIAIGAVILQVALNDLGPLAVAAYAAAQKIESIAMMPMMSFGIAMSAYTAQNYGARKFERIGEGVRKCCYMSVAFAVLAGAGLIFFGPSLMHLFVGDGAQQVIDFGHEYLIVNGSCYWILSFLFIFRYTLQGLGQSVVPTIAGIMELLMRTAAALFLCDWLGYLGACLANPMAWIGSCVPLAIAFYWTHRSFKKKYHLA